MSAKEQNRVVKAKDFDLGKVTFGEVKTSSNGMKNIWMNYGDQSIFLQTPELHLPFDTGNFKPDNRGGGKYEIYAQMTGHESDPGMMEFLAKMEEMDAMLKEAAMENSVSWFKKKTMTMDVVESVFIPMVKHSKDKETGEFNGKFPPGFKFKIKQMDGKVMCRCFKGAERVDDMNVNRPDQDDHVVLGIHIPDDEKMTKKHEGIFKKGTKVQMVLRCNGIWIINGKYGCTWSAEQIRIKSPPGFNDYAFLEDTDDEDDRGETLDADFVDSSSDDDGGDGDDELTRTSTKKA